MEGHAGGQGGELLANLDIAINILGKVGNSQVRVLVLVLVVVVVVVVVIVVGGGGSSGWWWCWWWW